MHAGHFGRLFLCLSASIRLNVDRAAAAPVALPDGTKLEKVDFERHVMGLFGKTGCNNGSCHGSFQGKNGFRLSLFGYEPGRDYAALTREIQGRRLNTVNPDASLLLQKAVGSVRHDGAARFSRDSWQYNVMREWIAQGAQWTRDSGKVVSLAMSPQEYVFVEVGKTAQVNVMATYADGSTENITPFCDFRVQDDAIATMSLAGVISAQKPGDSGLAISYRGNVVSARILVPTPMKSGFQYPKVEEVNYIDREVHAKLKPMNVVPSPVSSDLEFLRRIYVDTIGSLPSPDETRAFLADSRIDKREKKIDELLAHPLHAALWATKLSDITGNNTDALENPQNQKSARSQMWHDWLRKRMAENVPYDAIVRDILTATSRDDMSPNDWLEHVKLNEESAAKGFDSTLYAKRQTLDLFWRRQAQVQPDIWGQKVAAAFMGVRLECAECHKHPTDRWTQADYRAFANVFTNVSLTGFSSPEVKKVVDAENVIRKNAVTKNNQLVAIRELYVSPQSRNPLTHPETNAALKPKAPLGPVFEVKAGQDVRKQLFEWLRAPENPFFARSFVNRVWAHYSGMGLVEPVDDFSLANPPTNARLLDALARDFIDSKFNIREMDKRILMSRTYQSSSVPNETNRFDKNNFARGYIRPMMAEVMVDVLNTALGVDETPGNDVPSGKRIVEIGSSRFQNANVAYALRIFGRPPRTTACDCERVMEPALPQTLYRMTDSLILKKLESNNNRIGMLVKANKTDEEILEDLFLATLTRLPSTDEKTAFAEHRKTATDRRAALVDTLWALINTREFVLNH